jgi:hypothetical protein
MNIETLSTNCLSIFILLIQKSSNKYAYKACDYWYPPALLLPLLNGT